MKKPFFNRFMWLTLILSFVQQMIVASSNYWLVSSTKAIEANQPFFLLLIAYVASLLLPYFPGAMAILSLQKWVNLSQKRFIDQTASLLFGKIGIWNSEPHQAKKSPLIVKEAPAWIENTCQWVYSLGDAFLNFSLNILTLAVLIQADFLVVFLIGMGISWGVIWLQRGHMSTLSTNLESARAELTHVSQKFWDNILIGNKVNQEAWKNRFKTDFDRFDRRATRMEGFNQLVSVALAMLSNAPIFIYFFYLISRPETSNVQVLALVVLLPRVFQIVNSSHFFLWQITQSSSILARGMFIHDELKDFSGGDLKGRIQADKISVNGRLGDADLLLNNQPQKGRYTIGGQNGAGKSSLLIHLKQRYGDQAYYLPPQNHLTFDGQPISGSTGERMIKTLERVLDHNDGPSILLLDEWDGNLDQENTKRLDEVIDRIAQKNLVIEVRH